MHNDFPKCFRTGDKNDEVGMAQGSTKRGEMLTFHYQQRKDCQKRPWRKLPHVESVTWNATIKQKSKKQCNNDFLPLGLGGYLDSCGRSLWNAPRQRRVTVCSANELAWDLQARAGSRYTGFRAVPRAMLCICFHRARWNTHSFYCKGIILNLQINKCVNCTVEFSTCILWYSVTW